MAEIATGQVSELAALDAEIQGVYGHLGELLARRAALGQHAGESCVAAEVVADTSLDWLTDQYDLNKTALGELGFSDKVIAEQVPSLEQVLDGISPTKAIWLNKQRAEAGMHRRLAIVPLIQNVGLIGTSRKPGLITRFDKKQGDGDKTYVWGDLWDKFGDKAAVHDNGESKAEAWSAHVVLGDTTDPRDASEPANRYNEAGLVFTGLKVADQRDALKTEADDHRLAGREISPATIADIIIVNAQRRLEGKPLLDKDTFTRLTHYPDMPVGGDACVPFVDSDGRRMRLGGSDVRGAWGNLGVRRVLRVPVKA